MIKYKTQITGEDLRLARILYGYSNQEQIAKEFNCAEGTIQRYETMEIVPIEVLVKYEKILHFDLLTCIDYIADLRFKRNGMTAQNAPSL